MAFWKKLPVLSFSHGLIHDHYHDGLFHRFSFTTRNTMATRITKNSLGEHRPPLRRSFPHMLWPMSLTPNIARCVLEGLASLKGLADYRLQFRVKNQLKRSEWFSINGSWSTSIKDNIVGRFTIKGLWPSSLKIKGQSPSVRSGTFELKISLHQ